MTCSKCGYISDFHFQTCPQCSYDILEGRFRDPQKASSKQITVQSTSTPISVKETGTPLQATFKKPSTQYDYKIAQFSGQLTAGMFGAAKGVPLESQFQKFIEQYTTQGWDFYRMDAVHAYVKAGCIMSLFGRKDEVVYQDIVVFRRTNH